MTDAIRGFQGEYRFLSNFYPAPITYYSMVSGLRVFPTAENVFQWWKLSYADIPQEMREEYDAKFLICTPGQAKRFGRSIPNLKEIWNGDISFHVMQQVVRQKFTQHPDLVALLLETGDAELVEENNWGDMWWGTSGGVGRNLLGKILMMERDRWMVEEALLDTCE